jgi:transcriptional regulator with XRE-family HTH domain
MVSIANFIRTHSLSQEQFAKQLGVTRTTVAKLLAGDRKPSLQLLRKIHEVTQIPVKTLLYECT